VSDLPKTRAAAIDHLRYLSYRVGGEFCAGRAEEERLDAETDAALLLLGVTQEELDADGEQS
jgi:hypothetical protein